jgi:hypothetical protein
VPITMLGDVGSMIVGIDADELTLVWNAMP